MNYFSANIRFLRRKSALRQTDMPEKVGISRTTWSSYEIGASEPSIEGILKIASFFQVGPGDLLERDLTAEESIIGEKKNKKNEKHVRKNWGRTDKVEDLATLNSNDSLLPEVIKAKQQVIDSQSLTILALQTLVEHLQNKTKSKKEKEEGYVVKKTPKTNLKISAL